MIRQRLSDGVEGVLNTMKLRRAPDLPQQLHLSVTDRCFLPCLHCDIWKNDAVDLPTDDWLRLIDELGQWCAPAGINFVGGEPLLRKDLEVLISRAVGHRFTVSFNTNGWLLNPARARSIAEAGANIVYVSLDGIRQDTVDHSRGREGSFDKAHAAIRQFQEIDGPRVIVAAIIHAGNASEIPELLDWVESQGMQLVIQPLYQNFGYAPYDPQWWKKSPLFPRDEKSLRNIESVLDKLSVARMRGRPLCNESAQLQAMKFHFRYPEKDSGLSCRAGHSDLSFDPQGRIRLCYFLEPVGHISDGESVSKIWSNYISMRRRWQVSRCERHCSLLNCNFEV